MDMRAEVNMPCILEECSTTSSWSQEVFAVYSNVEGSRRDSLLSKLHVSYLCTQQILADIRRATNVPQIEYFYVGLRF